MNMILTLLNTIATFVFDYIGCPLVRGLDYFFDHLMQFTIGISLCFFGSMLGISLVQLISKKPLIGSIALLVILLIFAIFFSPIYMDWYKEKKAAELKNQKEE